MLDGKNGIDDDGKMGGGDEQTQWELEFRTCNEL